MGTRTIRCQVNDEYIQGAGVVVGAAGSHNDVLLELAFSPLWEGLAKTITWFDALGEHPTLTVLGTNLLAPGETEVYQVPIPPEAKAVAGELELTIRGAAVEDGTETRATVAATARFRVLPGRWDPDAVESQEITPSQAEQIQAQIEAIKPQFVAAAADASTAAAAAASATADREGAQAARETASQAAESAAKSAAAAEESAQAAEESQRAAQASQAAAAASEAQGAIAAAQAASSESKAAASQVAAANSQQAAQTSQTAAQASQAAAAASEQAAQRAQDSAAASQQGAAASEEKAKSSAADSEAWAVGQRYGVDVSPEDPAYQNNAKWYKDQAQGIAGGDYTTRGEAQGYVDTHNQASDAHEALFAGKADLLNGKVPEEQLPAMEYETAGAVAAHNQDKTAHEEIRASLAGQKESLDAHLEDQANPHQVTAQQVGADPAGSAAAVEERLLPQIERAEKLAESQMSSGSGATGELEDLEIRMGVLVNAGEGWNSFTFPVPFEGTPMVVLQPENFSGWAELREVTAEGFQYCLRQPVYTAGKLGTEGSVTTGTFYTASGTSSSSSYSANTLVSEVTLPGQPTLPSAENKTTAAAVRVHWMAAEWNGEES